MTATLAEPVALGDGTAVGEWKARLRSGLYPQCSHVLRHGDGYCAMGVLADVLVEDGLGVWEHNATGWLLRVNGVPHTRQIPTSLLALVGVKPQQAARVAMLNDDGHPFAVIADWLEGNL